MNKIKTIFSLIITFVLTFTFASLFTVNASNDVVYSENGKGSWKVNEETKENIYGMNYIHALGETSASGAVNGQQVNVFEMKTDGTYSKIVNWAIQDSVNSYKRATIMDIAKDYEAKHPGWIVLGGINADQYAMTANYAGTKTPFYPQPFYPLVMDGERRFVTGLTGPESNFVGFKNDGTSESFEYESHVLGYYVCIYDENNKEINRIYLEGFNQEPSSNGTTVWMPYLNQGGNGYICDVVSGNLYVVENPELQYISNAPLYGIKYSGFGKGIISKKTNEHALKEGQFLIESNDINVETALKEGTKIIVQGVYANENLNSVECTAGFHSAQRLNDKDVVSNQSYDTQTYSRSIFGRKADGSYVLVTVDMFSGQYKGMTQDESNAMLKSYGVVEAYQQDGGGSVTACVRNSIGTFDLVNKPKDGATRTVFNGLFFVVRDPGFRVNKVSNTRNSIIIKQEVTVNSDLVKNAKAIVNGKEYIIEGENTEIKGLEENTSYDVTFVFDMYNEKTNDYESCTYTISTQTKAFEIPKSGLNVTNVDKNSITLVMKESEYSDYISNVLLEVDGFEYNIGSSKTYEVTGLIEDTEYVGTITYDVYDPESGKTYEGKETIQFTTLVNALPQIKRFEQVRLSENKITFGFEYVDKDNVVKGAYIYYNRESITLDIKSGTVSIDNLDFENTQYTFYLMLTYDDGKSLTLKKLSSEKIIYGTETSIKNITYELDGGVLPEDAPKTFEIGVGLAELPTPTKEGYIFKGWLYNGKSISKISTTMKVNITLQATWEADPNYNPGGTDQPGGNEEPGGSSSSCNMGANIQMLLGLSTTLSLMVIALRKKK